MSGVRSVAGGMYPIAQRPGSTPTNALRMTPAEVEGWASMRRQGSVVRGPREGYRFGGAETPGRGFGVPYNSRPLGTVRNAYDSFVSQERRDMDEMLGRNTLSPAPAARGASPAPMQETKPGGIHTARFRYDQIHRGRRGDRAKGRWAARARAVTKRLRGPRT